MKFAFIIDSCLVKSYYIKDGKSYAYENDEIYTNHNSLSADSMVGMWNYPYIFDGCFLNWVEWGDNLPDYDLELIIVAIEKDFKNYNVEKLRKKYPNAVIIGMVKEIFLGNVTEFGPTQDVNSEKHKNRTKFFNECDGVFQCFPDLESSPLSYLQEEINKPIEYLPFPVDVDYMYDNYYGDKINGVYFYLPHSLGRRKDTYEFSKHITDKYKLPLNTKELIAGKSYDYMSLHDFVSLWSQYSFHINLDPASWFPGSQAVQVATTGTIQVGGLNDSHRILYPQLATNDLEILETEVDKIISDFDYRVKIINYAYENVQKYYSFDTVRQSVEKMIRRIK